MHQIFQIALVVRDYDEALDFYCNKLGFALVEDTVLSETKRWVVVSPEADGKGARLLLAKAATPVQQAAIGNQTGGRVFLFMHTNNLDADYERLKQYNITIVREPEEQPFGKVLVFADLYGNLWDLIQPHTV